MIDIGTVALGVAAVSLVIAVINIRIIKRQRREYREQSDQ